MPVSVHSIRTLNSLPPSSMAVSSSTSTSTQRFVNLGGFMHKQPQGLNIGSWRGSPSTHIKQGESSKRTQRPSIRLPYTSRRVPPPSPSPKLSTIYYMTEDPFSDSDSFDPTRTVIYDSNSSRSRRGSSNAHHTFDTDIPRQVAIAPDREARSKLVAGILLHRVHAVGKPLRRVPMIREGPREYVRSGLSAMITMEA